MTDNELSAIIDSASMIVDGYAFSQIGEDNIRCVGINKPHHAAIMRQDGEVLETNMDDVELDIVGEYTAARAFMKASKTKMLDNRTTNTAYKR